MALEWQAECLEVSKWRGKERFGRTGKRCLMMSDLSAFKTREREGDAFEQYIHQIMVDQSGGSSSIDLVLVFSFFGIFGYILPHMQVAKL